MEAVSGCQHRGPHRDGPLPRVVCRCGTVVRVPIRHLRRFRPPSRGFFSDRQGVEEIIGSHLGSPADPEFRFLHSDYKANLGLPEESFDLLVSLYAGFVSEHCTQLLRVGGVLLVNPSHGDAAMASIDSRYRLRAVVISRSGAYRIGTTGLDSYLIPKSSVTITAEFLHERARGIGYTKSPFAYLFERTR